MTTYSSLGQVFVQLNPSHRRTLLRHCRPGLPQAVVQHVSGSTGAQGMCSSQTNLIPESHCPLLKGLLSLATQLFCEDVAAAGVHASAAQGLMAPTTVEQRSKPT